MLSHDSSPFDSIGTALMKRSHPACLLNQSESNLRKADKNRRFRLCISDAHGIYGFQKIEVVPSLDKIFVEYDASRVSRDGVEARLRGAGIPVKPL